MGIVGFASIRKESFPEELIDKAQWLTLIAQIPELRLIHVRHLRDPFTGQPFLLRSDATAELIQHGKSVGVFAWAEGEIWVDGTFSMLDLARRIADALGAGVVDDHGEELLDDEEFADE